MDDAARQRVRAAPYVVGLDAIRVAPKKHAESHRATRSTCQTATFDSAQQNGCECGFCVINAKQPFTPGRVARKPFVQGPKINSASTTRKAASRYFWMRSAIGILQSRLTGTGTTRRLSERRNHRREAQRTESVGHDETITIGIDRSERGNNNEKIPIGANRTDTVNEKKPSPLTPSAQSSPSPGDRDRALATHAVGIDETVSVARRGEVIIGAFQAVPMVLTKA
ncbi:hypothetical protein P9250_25120 [Caballeronia sp. LP006]|nr:hypothetical protein [Caballeronia sp. LP006]MDR5831161.1 hypothetical protein [Caballeronia sp. LP006]